MSQSDYSTEQEEVLGSVRGLVSQLRIVEDLQRRRYQTILNVDDALDQAVADICMDNYPSYHVLEERLRKAVTEARGFGLSEDPFIVRIGSLAFS